MGVCVCKEDHTLAALPGRTLPSKPLWTLGAPQRAGSPPIDSFLIKQTKMWAGIRKLELPYRDSVATSPPISFQSCLAIFKSNTGLSLGLESQSLKEHSVCVSCHAVMVHSRPASPWILKYHTSSGWERIYPQEESSQRYWSRLWQGRLGGNLQVQWTPAVFKEGPWSGISQLAGGFIHGTARQCWLIHHQCTTPRLPPQQLFSSTQCLVLPSFQEQLH